MDDDYCRNIYIVDAALRGIRNMLERHSPEVPNFFRLVNPSRDGAAAAVTAHSPK